MSERTLIRWKKNLEDQRRGPKSHPFKITPSEEEKILKIINSEEFMDEPPHKIVPRLADQGIYLASESSIYRILKKHGMNSYRARSKPKTSRPQIDTKASGPNQVWCWDITLLKSPVVGKHYYLYMVMDLFSRKVVAHEVFEREREEHSMELFAKAFVSEMISGEGLRIHSDNGGPMRGAGLLEKYRSLGVIPSFSRPFVKNDNAYAEALFRTLKYVPKFPYKPFNDMDHAKKWVDQFVSWYNKEHTHSSIKYVTPEQKHRGEDKEILALRKAVYETARESNPLRWSTQTRNWDMVTEVSINPQSTRTVA